MTDEIYAYEETSSSSSSPADCRYGLKLECKFSVYNVVGRAQAWRMVVTVIDSYNVSPDIFLYQKSSSPDPVTNEFEQTWECVCSPVDLESWPVGEARPTDDPAFFRLSSVDLITRNRELLVETWKCIKQDQKELIDTLVGICQLAPEAVNSYGYFPEDDIPEMLPELHKPLLQAPAPVFAGIKITESNDPDYPTGVSLELESSDELPPNYERKWMFYGMKTNTKLTIETSLTAHRYICYLAHSQVSAGKLANGYKAIINYVRSGSEYTIHIAGV